MKEIDENVVQAVLEDWKTAPVPPRLKEALGFLEKVSLHPEEVTSEDARRVLHAGVSQEAVRELLYVCFLFNALDRLADSLDFSLPSERDKLKIGTITYRLGYRVAKLPG